MLRTERAVHREQENSIRTEMILLREQLAVANAKLDGAIREEQEHEITKTKLLEQCLATSLVEAKLAAMTATCDQLSIRLDEARVGSFGSESGVSQDPAGKDGNRVRKRTNVQAPKPLPLEKTSAANLSERPKERDTENERSAARGATASESTEELTAREVPNAICPEATGTGGPPTETDAEHSTSSVGSNPAGRPVVISRADLYRQVWNVPVQQLATTYGLSDRGLAKICQRHNIPLPGRGYWAKLHAGQQPPREPLLPIAEEKAVLIHSPPPKHK
jgi:hypothetical protein